MAVRNVIERCSQTAVVIILQRHEAEGLEHAFCSLAHRVENLRHAVYRSRLRLKSNFNKVALRQRAR